MTSEKMISVTHEAAIPPPMGMIHSPALHEIFAATRFQGVYWTHTVPSAVTGATLTACRGAPCPVGSAYSDHYWSGPVEHDRGVRIPIRIPPIGPGAYLPSREFCPSCADAFPRPFILAPICAIPGCTSPDVYLRLARGDLLVTPRLSSDVITQLQDTTARWAAPAEPADTLRENAVRLVELDDSSLLKVRGSFIDVAGILDRLGPNGPPPPFIDPPPDPAIAILAGNDSMVYLVGEATDSYIAIGAVPGSPRETVQLAGPAIGRVVAGTLAARSTGLLVLDEATVTSDEDGAEHDGRDEDRDGHRHDRMRTLLRLLAVDFGTSTTTVVATFPWVGAHDRFALAGVADGTYVLAASSTRARGGYVLVRFSVASAGMRVLGFVNATGAPMVGPIVADARGVTVPVGTDPWQPVGHLFADFRPARSHDFDDWF